jgi:signal transduction histidine kinase
MVDACTTLVDLIIATLLYVQASVFRSRALGALATGYVFTGLILIPHALTFPGAFARTACLARVSAPRRGSTSSGGPGSRSPSSRTCCSTGQTPLRHQGKSGRRGEPAFRYSQAVALVVAVTILTTIGHDLLPRLYIDRAVSNYANMIGASSAVIALAVVSMIMLFRERKSALDVWLLVVMSAWLVQTLLFLSLRGRFTAAWYFTDAVVLLSHLYLMLALIAESSRLYARLAISTAAQNREREARLMSMDAVAAAISHEVGQPLSAVITNATGGLNWLARERPDPEMAIKALNATIDAGKRATDVVKSIRAMVARKPGTPTEFDLNELVRETASLLDRELASEKVSLQLTLDESLPPIVADRCRSSRC